MSTVVRQQSTTKSPGGEIGRHKGLKIPRTKHPCRFDPGPGHHFKEATLGRFFVFARHKILYPPYNKKAALRQLFCSHVSTLSFIYCRLEDLNSIAIARALGTLSTLLSSLALGTLSISIWSALSALCRHHRTTIWADLHWALSCT